ncbi:hypothetical protein [Roseateles sp. BYS87W]|uniref:DUF2846 domain-containing protein n=1 Tax=Pelomonas baiyunensis TaxID=3299026 RepID=A0ABW7H1S2_9BURK
MTDLSVRSGLQRLLLVLACLMGVAACGSTLPPVRDVEGLPCLTFRKTHQPNRICAAQPAVSPALAQQVQQFLPERDSGVVIVHWRERAGATRPLELRVDGQPVAQLVPGGLVRLRLNPGAHEMSVSWGSGQIRQPLSLAAGRVQFAEVAGRLSFWNLDFAWTLDEGVGFRQRAAEARVLADLDLRQVAAMPGAPGGSVSPSP